MRALRALVVTTTLGLLAVLIGPAGARAAGEPHFTVANCQSDPHFSTAAFRAFATRGMKVESKCNQVGREPRGLVAKSRLHSGNVPRGATAWASIYAPPGTHFKNFRWNGFLWRSDCRYTIDLFALSPAGLTPLKRLIANHKCTKHKAQATISRILESFPKADGSTRIVQRVICAGGNGHKFCSTDGSNFALTRLALVDVVDTQPPAATIVPDTPLTEGAWVSGSQPLDYDANDNVGVRTASVFSGARWIMSDARPCAFATDDGSAFQDTVPCSNGRGHILINTQHITEGTQQLTVQPQDTAGILGPPSTPVTVHIDNTPPGRVDVGVVGGDAWRNINSFMLSWANPLEIDRAPISGVIYKLCAVAPAGCVQATRGGTSIATLPLALPHPGQWVVSLWRQDAAGNADPALASVPVTLRYDPEPPAVAFNSPSAADPTLISANVSDQVSGIAGGAIEISQVGTNVWRTLSTHLQGNRLVARVDDAALPPGDYIVRATASDLAQNQAATASRADGQPMLLTLPLRVASAIKLGVVQQRVVRQTIRRHGKRRKIRRRIPVLKPTATVRLGQRVQVKGRLVNRNGDGIASSDVQVFSSSAAVPEQLVAVVRTDAGGDFHYTAAGSTTRTLRFAYVGSPLLLPSQSHVALVVPATSTLRVSRRQVLNGQRVVFRGRVKSVPLPTGGKLVQLEVRLPGRWQTFRTARSDVRGRWAVPYRFTRTHGVQRYRFRVELPPEAGYPFAAGRSRSVSVRVSGQ